MATFTYDFSDLPLAIVDGIAGGFINGQAEIIYSSDGGWHVSTITLEGFGERVNNVRQWPQVKAPDAVTAIVRKRLYNEWFDKVQNEINEAIEEDHACAADDHADMRREARMMERF